MPKGKRKDIPFTSVSVAGTKHTWRYNGKVVVVDYGVSPAPLVRREIRKLARDTTEPLSRREKPYHTLKANVTGIRGGVCYNHAKSGQVHYVQVGDLQGESLGASPKIIYCNMGYPNGTPRYLPVNGEWPINPDLLSQAEVKCYAAMRNKYGELDLDSNLSFGIWFGERKELAALVKGAGVAMLGIFTAYRQKDPSMLARSIQHFRKTLRDGEVLGWAKQEIRDLRRREKKRGGPGRALRTVDSVNQAILTWNLGVSPLLQDVDRVYTALRYDTVKDPSALLIKAKGWVERNEADTEVLKTDRGHVTVVTNVNHLVRYTSVMIVRPSLTDRALFERLGLGNPMSLIAELTTCSFIVNYFYGILDYLKAISTPQAFEFVDGSWSKKVSHICNVAITSSSSSGNRKAAGNWTHFEYQRKVYTSFPFPTPPLSLKGRSGNSDVTFRQDLNTGTVAWSRVRKALSS